MDLRHDIHTNYTYLHADKVKSRLAVTIAYIHRDRGWKASACRCCLMAVGNFEKSEPGQYFCTCEGATRTADDCIK